LKKDILKYHASTKRHQKTGLKVKIGA